MDVVYICVNTIKFSKNDWLFFNILHERVNLTLQIRSTGNSLTLRSAYSVDKSMIKTNNKVHSDFGPYRKIIDIDSR